MHECCFCGYQCGFLFQIVPTRRSTIILVHYDKGCDCVTFENIVDSSMDSVLKHIAMQTSDTVKQKHAVFWGY